MWPWPPFDPITPARDRTWLLNKDGHRQNPTTLVPFCTASMANIDADGVELPLPIKGHTRTAKVCFVRLMEGLVTLK